MSGISFAQSTIMIPMKQTIDRRPPVEFRNPAASIQSLGPLWYNQNVANTPEYTGVGGIDVRETENEISCKAA